MKADPIPFWWFHGELDVGGRFFVNNPQRDGLNYLRQDSLAKYYQYSTVKPGPFGNVWLSTGSRDGLYQVDIGGKNIGYSDQYYWLDASKAGEHYFNFQWDQTPHLYSTSARTIYDGIGTNHLTLRNGLSTALFGAASAGNFFGPRVAFRASSIPTLIRPILVFGAIRRRSNIGGPRPTPGTSRPTIRTCAARAPRRWAWFSILASALSRRPRPR